MTEFDTLEAANFLHCSQRQLYNLIKRHELDGTFFRVGRRFFFIKDKLQNWKDAGGSNQNNI